MEKQTKMTTCDTISDFIKFETSSIHESSCGSEEMESQVSEPNVEELSDDKHIVHRYLSFEECSPIVPGCDLGSNTSVMPPHDNHLIKSDPGEFVSSLSCPTVQPQCDYDFPSLETKTLNFEHIEIKEEVEDVSSNEDLSSNVNIEIDEGTVRKDDESDLEDENDDHFSEASPEQHHPGVEHLTWAERADTHLAFGACGGNPRAAKRLYAERYPKRQLPLAETFSGIDRQLREVGSFGPAIPCGRPSSRRKSPRLEEDALGRNLGIKPRAIHNQDCNSTARRVHDKGLHRLRLFTVRALKPADLQLRMNFAQWYLNQNVDVPGFAATILWTDEACFSRDGFLNCNNSHIWELEYPQENFVHHHQDQFRVNVWAGILGDTVLGPIFLLPTLDASSHLAFLQNDLPVILEEIPLSLRLRMWLQQDGAASHFGRIVRDHLDEVFPGRWIGRGGPVAWPARSPDISPLDFFLWRHVQSAVYARPVPSQKDLLIRIQAAFNQVRAMPGVTERVRQSISRRCHVCIEAGGGNFQHFL